MSTTIDSLVIDIQSTSTNAVSSIESLARSLEKMKSSTVSAKSINNLRELTRALKELTPVSSNANKLGAMAESLSKLSQVGSLRGVVNQLSSLAPAMRSLGEVNLTGIDSKIKAIANAVAPLSNVKAGGINSIASGLSKLQKIDLDKIKFDDEKVRAFAAEVKKLDNAIGPLSTKLVSISAAFKAVNTSTKSAGTGMQSLGTKVSATALNLSSFTTIVQGITAALQPIIRLLSEAISQAIEWDGIAARFGRGFGSQADETYAWIQRLNKEMGINIQQFMQYSSVYATMLTGFGVAVEDAGKMALGYTELTYDIWAGYNDIYKSYADAADAVKSAIAGEVEPIRRAGFTIVEATLEQTAANHGLEISLANATEAQKSYLRYLTLIDQAHAQNLVGTYARELNTAEGLMRTFSQQLKSLAQAIGSLFLPILVKVIPWVQAFVEVLIDAIRILASFFGITIQEVDWGGFGDGISAGAGGVGDLADSAEDASGSLGSAAKAAKDLKKATLGIDELNVISPPEKTGGSGGGGGGGAGDSVWDDLDVESLWDESIFGQIQSKVDDIKKKFEDWLPVIATIGTALGALSLVTLLKNLGDALSAMNTLQKLLATIAIVTIEAALVFTFADKYLESGNLLYLIGEAIVTAAAGYLLFKAWGPSGLALALTVSIAAQLAAIEMNLADGTISLSSDELWKQAIVTVLTGAIGGAVLAKYTGFFAKEGFVIGLGVTISLTMMAINMGAIESGEIDTNSFESWIMQAIGVAGAGLSGFQVGKAIAGTTAGGKTGLLIGVTVGLVLNLASVVGAKGDDFGDSFSDWLNAAITTGMTGLTAAKLWKIAGPTITSALTGLAGKVGAWLSGGGLAAAGSVAWPVAVAAAVVGMIVLAFVDYDFTEIGRTVGEKIGEALKWSFDNLSPIGLGIKLLTWLKNELDLESIKEAVAALFKKETWTDVIFPKIEEIFTSVWELIKEKFENLAGNLGEFQDGLLEGLGEAFNIDLSSLDFLTINDAGDVLALFFPPATIANMGIDFWEQFKESIKKAWPTAESWWNDTTASEKIEVGVSLIKKGWSTLTGWIGSIPVVSQGVKLVKEGWKSVKAWIGDIPVISQGIKLVKSGWSSVKNWIGKIPTLSQAIKLAKSGWKSVKSWIGNIPKVNQAVGLIKSGWKSVKAWIGTMPSLSAKIGLIKNGWTSVKSWLGGLSYKLSFSLPKIGIRWGKKEFAGFEISYPKEFYTYAKGGFPDLGELFIAREAGPEMVGKIGNKTTVANNDQIVEGISEGVYAAVLAAMKSSESGGGQSVNVYLDGRQITASVEQHQRSRGASLLGNQVYAY